MCELAVEIQPRHADTRNTTAAGESDAGIGTSKIAENLIALFVSVARPIDSVLKNDNELNESQTPSTDSSRQDQITNSRGLTAPDRDDRSQRSES